MLNKALLLLLFAFVTAANARADGIHYDRIPADVSGYVHVDLDRVLSSPVLRGAPQSKEFVALISGFFGEHPDFTVYLTKAGGPGGWVLVWHTHSATVRKRLEASIAGSKTAVTISYGQQEIHYSSSSASDLIKGLNVAPPGQPVEPSKKDDAPAEKRPEFSIGLGQNDDPNAPSSYRGPSHTAFIGEDLIVMAGDLPSIAGELDVINGKSASLAQQDPQGLKMESPAGAMLVGAGLTASYSIDKSKKPEEHAARHGEAAGPIGFDIFGSFKTRARLARFDVGEDDKQFYIDAVLTMNDAESSEQLKNLVNGVRALITLTHEEAKPLLAPLEVRSAEKEVAIRWSWPTEKLPELLKLVQVPSAQGRPMPATAPAKPLVH